jgi:hypothetical protein
LLLCKHPCQHPHLFNDCGCAYTHVQHIHLHSGGGTAGSPSVHCTAGSRGRARTSRST